MRIHHLYLDIYGKLEDIKKIALVGGGTMGFGIAINFALRAYTVTVSDINKQILQGSRKHIRSRNCPETYLIPFKGAW